MFLLLLMDDLEQNWLVDILDASSLTHCRNEPNEVEGASLEYLQSLWYSKDALEKVISAWDERVAIAKISTSERDHHIETPKQHVYAISQKIGLSSWPVRPKIRRVLRLFLSDLRRGEWRVPWWISDRYALQNSCAVIKVNMLAAWFVNWHIHKYPNCPTIHIVRHPGGYLNSSIRRFFSQCTASQLHKERQYYGKMLSTAVQIAPHWSDILGDIESMDSV